jgi:hypothetical protein
MRQRPRHAAPANQLAVIEALQPARASLGRENVVTTFCGPRVDARATLPARCLSDAYPEVRP